MADSSTYVNVGLGVVGTGAGVASAVLGYKTYQNSKATSAPAAQVRTVPPVTYLHINSFPLCSLAHSNAYAETSSIIAR